MRSDEAAWVAFWAAFAVIDYTADRRGHSLCTATRRLARMHTLPGGLLARGALLGGAVVLYGHMFRPVPLHRIDRAVRLLDGLRR